MLDCVPDELPSPTALIGAKGTLIAADARFRALVAPAWAAAPPRALRRLAAALRLTRRRGRLTLRLAAPLEGWTVRAQTTPDGVAVALADGARRLESAVNDLLLAIAADGEGFARIDRRGRWRWLSPRLAMGAMLGRTAPRAATTAAQCGRPVVDLVVCPPSENGAVWLLTARPVFDAWGRPDGLIGVVRSAWNCGQSGGAARRLEVLARAIDPGFALYDEDGRLRLASDAYVESFEADALSFPLAGSAPDWRAITALGEDRRPPPGAETLFEVRTAESRRLTVRRTSLPGGGWVESLSDVTAARRAQAADADALQRVRRTERAKQALMEAVGVELFAAAAKVRASLRGVAEHGGGMAAEFAGMMSQGLRRLFATARDVRAYSILENRETQLERAPVALADLIHQTVAGRRVDADKVGVTLDLHTPENPSRQGDPAFLALALDHLLSNAIKFSRPGGRVDVTLTTPAGEDGPAVIAVIDDGVGVTPESLERIQTPFVQGEEDAERRAYEGSGLGLAICRAVMRLHGGRLEIDGAPDQGVQARLIVPSDHPPAAEVAPASPPTTPAPPPDPRLFHLAPTPLAQLDAAWGIHAVNPAAEAFFAQPAAALLGRPLAVLLGPAAAPLGADAFAQGYADRPWRIGDDDVWARATVAPTADGGWVVGWEDATDLCRLAEMAASERRRLIAAATEDTDWFWSSDADHHYDFLSPRRARVGGPDRGDQLHAPRPAAAAPADPAADSPEAAAHRADLAAHRPFHHWIERFRSANGENCARRVSGAPQFDDRGRFQGYVGVVESAGGADDLRRADRAKAARLRAAFDAAPFGVIIWDEDGRLVFWNRRYAETLPRIASRLRIGMTADEAARLTAEQGDVVAEDPAAWAALRREQRRQPVSSMEVRLGDGRWSLWSDRRAADGGAIGVRLDVTQRKQAERRIKAARAAAEQADAAKRNFLAVVSHELRTPLNAVIGFAELLRMPPADGSAHSAAAQAAADTIVRNGRRLQRICDRIIDYVRIESGDYPLADGRAVLSGLLRDAAQGGGPPPAEITVDPILRLDPAALRRAVRLTAAALAEHHPGEVRLAVAVDWGQGVALTLTPADAGGDPLYDPNALTATLKPGDGRAAIVLGEGLAIAIARGLMRLLDGDLILTTAADGRPVAQLTLPPSRIVALNPLR